MNDGAHSYQYDAEGNVLQVDGGTTASYVYDAFNRRIAEQTPSGTHEFTYDYAGRRISGWLSSSNYGDQGRIYWNNQQIAFRAGDGTNFDHQDTLGTERMRTLYDGSVGASYQSLPWGDGYTATVNNSYAGLDSLDFAGLERDVQSTTNPEEDTEHAQFRNYAPAQGRWLSPDRYLGSYDFANPQSLNRYAYVLNNPTSFTDPSGLLNCKFGPCASPAPGCDDGCPPASPPSPSSGDPGCWSCGGTPGGGGGGGGGQPGNQQIYTFSKTVYSTWLQNFDLQLWILTSVPFSSSSGQGVAPNKGGCIVVNGGTTVCPSELDNLFNPNHRGKQQYRDSSPFCSTHTTTDANGQNPESHIDLYNPTVSVPATPMGQSTLFLHFIYDEVPDAIYDVTGKYFFPAGRDQCK